MKKNETIYKTGTNKLVKFTLIFSTLFLLSHNQLISSGLPADARAQQSQEKRVTLRMSNSTLTQILMEIRKQTGLAYGFRDDRDANSTEQFSINVRNVNASSALSTLFNGTNYTYSIDGNFILISRTNRQQAASPATRRVTGRVFDERGNPIVGATVAVHGTTRGTATDAHGRYEIVASPDDVLRVSFIGYKQETVPVNSRTTIDVSLATAVENIQEVTVVAFGEQKTESVVSSITTIKPMDLKSSSSDLTTSFAGKIPGMIAWQTSGLPGVMTENDMNSKFYIRGITSFNTTANIDPLILLDGVESSKLDLARLAVEDIESFSVMKDASATAMYGARGANGVILVTTKKGEEGSVYTSLRYEAIASMSTSEIDVVDPITYMQMYNQALTTRDPSASPKYSVERIDRTGSNKYPSWVYPANDWYDQLFKNFSVNHHFGVNIRGGSKVVQYYASVNHNFDQGMLNTDRLNQFNVNIKHNVTSFRTNLNIDLKAGIKLVINATASLDKYHGPYTDVTQAYQLAFAASPVDFAPMYPGDADSAWPHLRFGSTGSAANMQTNPYLEMHRGYKERERYSATNRVEYIHNLGTLVKGLEFRASVSLSKTGYNSTTFATAPFVYSLTNYDFVTGKHTLSLLNPLSARRTLGVEGSTAFTNSTQMTYEVRLMHSAAWGDHQTSVTAVANALESTSSPIGSVLGGMPHRNMGFSMRGTYGYKDRYFVEASFGYNGSERFDKDHRMGFFPAGGIAWLISRENFLENSRWLPYLKFRATYGKVGNDGIVSNPRFVYLPDVYKSSNIVSPSAAENVVQRYLIAAYANPLVKWEVAEQVNFGLDAKLFKGIFEFTFDAYQEVRHNIIASRSVIPASMGIEINPIANIGKTRSRGFDFSGKIQHAFNPDFWMILNATATYNKAKYLKIEEASDKPLWQRMVGHEISQAIGYIAEGLFKDQAEINNSPVQGGNLMPGDIKYRDLNDDGVIDVNDATYIGFPQTPRLIYGFSGFINYKNLEFNFSFQGSGKRGFFLNPASLSPFVNDNAMLTAIYKDHWSEDNTKNKPLWPRLSTSNITTHNPQEDWYNRENNELRKSTYFMRECWFVRCTALEIAYNLSAHLMQRLKLQNMKVYFRANNPFVISDFKIWDVELGEEGFNYPLQKTFAIGLNLSF